jgi:hypothetical protein
LLFICLNFGIWEGVKDGLMDGKGALDQGEGFTFLILASLDVCLFLSRGLLSSQITKKLDLT